jgi:hypothetical protein
MAWVYVMRGELRNEDLQIYYLTLMKSAQSSVREDIIGPTVSHISQIHGFAKPWVSGASKYLTNDQDDNRSKSN